MNKWFKVINAYIHDFASALWLATVLVVFLASRYIPPSGAEDFFFQFKKEFLFIGIGSLVVILVTGIIRTLTYKSGAYGEESEDTRKKILIIKHMLGLIVYGTGTYWQYVMVYG